MDRLREGEIEEGWVEGGREGEADGLREERMEEGRDEEEMRKR